MPNPIYLVYSIIAYCKEKRHCIKLAGMSYPQIRDFQFDMLKDLVVRAWNNVPFYRMYWGEHGFTPDKFNSINDIEKIPIIDRNDIINNLEKFVPTNYNRNRLSSVTTGGTSGMPMKFYIDNYIARAKEMAFLNVIYKNYFNCKPYYRIAIFRGLRVNDKLLSKNFFWRYSFQQRGLVFSAFHLTMSNLKTYLTRLREYHPSFIRAYPSAIVELCSLMKAAKEAPIKNLKGVICSSENIYEWQRELVREVLHVEIYSLYGHSEKCVLAFQTEDKKMMFHPLYGLTEFLDKDGKQAKEGEQAEVVVTGFRHEYFPLIRYRTNDLVEVGYSENPTIKVANKIIGREQDFVIDKNENKIQFTNQDEPFWGIEGVIAYQYIQNEKGKLELNIQTGESYSITQDSKILDGAHKIFIDFEIKISHVEFIERTERGKFKYLIQNLRY